MKALDDNRIVEMYLLRDEAAVKHTAEKYGSRLLALGGGAGEHQQQTGHSQTKRSQNRHVPGNHLFKGAAGKQIDANLLR